MNAAQRLTTFNFYLGSSSLLSGGLAAAIKGIPVMNVSTLPAFSVLAVLEGGQAFIEKREPAMKH